MGQNKKIIIKKVDSVQNLFIHRLHYLFIYYLFVCVTLTSNVEPGRHLVAETVTALGLV